MIKAFKKIRSQQVSGKLHFTNSKEDDTPFFMQTNTNVKFKNNSKQ